MGQMTKRAMAIAAVLATLCGFTVRVALADDCPRGARMPGKDMTPPQAMRSMKMDAPMPTPMARPGTMAMDVTEAQAAKQHCMQPMLEHEEKMMDGTRDGAR